MTRNSLRLLPGWALLVGSSLALASHSAAAQAVSKAPALPPAARGKLPAPTPTATPTTIEDRANTLTTNMAQGLSLTPAQTEKVRAINVGAVRTVEAARLRYRQEPTTLRSHIEEAGLARLEQLKDVLTPAQFMRYQQKREEKMGIPTAQGRQGTPPPGLGGHSEDN